MASPVWRLAWRLVFGAALVLSLWLALLPGGGPPALNHQDKLLHAGAFATLWWLGRQAGLALPGRPALVLGLALLGFGGLIEIAQGVLTTTRDPSWADLLADAVGLALGWQLWRPR